MSGVIVGGRAADWCAVSAPTSHLSRQTTTANTHSLWKQVVRVWQRKEHG